MEVNKEIKSDTMKKTLTFLINSSNLDYFVFSTFLYIYIYIYIYIYFEKKNFHFTDGYTLSSVHFFVTSSIVYSLL